MIGARCDGVSRTAFLPGAWRTIMLKSTADWSEGPSLSLTAPPGRLDPISSLSTEAAAGNIVRVEGGLKLERMLFELDRHHIAFAKRAPKRAREEWKKAAVGTPRPAARRPSRTSAASVGE